MPLSRRREHSDKSQAAELGFLLTAPHCLADVDQVVALRADIVAQQRPRQRIKVAHVPNFFTGIETSFWQN
jgi:hypothetical protein